MKGTVERETRRKALEARATRLLVASLQQPTVEPVTAPEMRIPGEIGSVLLPHEYDE